MSQSRVSPGCGCCQACPPFLNPEPSHDLLQLDLEKALPVMILRPFEIPFIGQLFWVGARIRLRILNRNDHRLQYHCQYVSAALVIAFILFTCSSWITFMQLNFLVSLSLYISGLTHNAWCFYHMCSVKIKGMHQVNTCIICDLTCVLCMFIKLCS